MAFSDGGISKARHLRHVIALLPHCGHATPFLSQELTAAFDPRTLAEMDMHTGFSLQGWDLVSHARVASFVPRMPMWCTQRCGPHARGLLLCAWELNTVHTESRG